MPVFAVRYTYDDRTEQRAQVRPAHREFLRVLLEAGHLLASGPVAGPTLRADGSEDADEPDGALLLVAAASAREALERLAADPFAEHGFLTDVTARAWDPVLGPFAGRSG